MRLTEEQFIETAYQIIMEEGIEKVSIRTIGKRLGCSSAAMYKYFSNLDELMLFACIRFLKEYINELQQIIERGDFNISMYLEIWERYCRSTYAKPEIYNHLFFGPYSENLSVVLREYYDIFGGEIYNQDRELYALLMQGDIYQRNRILLDKCGTDFAMSEAQKEVINDIHVSFYEGVLKTLMDGHTVLSVAEAVTRTMNCIRFTFNQLTGE